MIRLGRFVPCALVLWFGTTLAAQETGAGAADRPIPLDGFEELWRVGGTSATGWDAFGSVRTVAFTPHGGVVVHDRRAKRVVVVGPGGELVHELADEGDGPGEFRFIHTVLVGHDGGFTVYDGSHQAFKLFTGTGQFRTAVRVGVDASAPWIRPPLTPSNRSDAAFLAVPTDSGRTRMIERVVFEDNSVRTEPFYQAWRSAEQGLRDGVTFEITYSTMTGQPEAAEAFFPQLQMDRLPGGGLLVVDSSAYEVKILDPAGSVTGVVCRPIAPVVVDAPIRRAMQEQRRKKAEEDVGGSELVLDPLMKAIEDMRFFAEVPVVTDVRAGWNGEIWVRRHGEDPVQEDGPIDIFSSDGTYVGTFGEAEFHWPGALGPDGLAAFIERDELGVQAVSVARLPSALRRATPSPGPAPQARQGRDSSCSGRR